MLDDMKNTVKVLLFVDSIFVVFGNTFGSWVQDLLIADQGGKDRKFGEYSTVCITTMFGYEPDPMYYKIIVGSWEICSAIGLLFQELRHMACVILGIIMLGAIQTYINLHDYTETIVPAFFFLTLCYIYGMASRDLKKVKEE